MINLLFIDDNLGDLELMEMYFKPITKIQIDVSTEEPALQKCSNYDGIIIDQYLSNGLLGIDIALAISRQNPMIPIMLYTGDFHLETEDAKSVVDEVCNKNDMVQFGRNLTAFVRQIDRIKFLKDRIKELEEKYEQK